MMWVSILVACLSMVLGASRAVAQRPMGVDVSSYQGAPNWSSVKASGISFAWAKATEGASITDGSFTYNQNNGKAAGVYMGAYHFAHPELNSPSSEASHFWAVAGPYIKADGKTLMPVLDFEVFSGVVGASSYSDWANQWFNDILNYASAAGVAVKPILYTSSCSACNFDSSVSRWMSWIANYNGQNPQSGTPWSVCGGCNVWGGWNAWQYSSSGSVSGISGGCDVDVFNGSMSSLVSTLVIGSVQSTPASGYCVGPIAMNTDGTLEMFGVTANNTPAHEYQNNPNGSWTALFNMGGITGIPGITVARNPDGRLEIFCVNSADKKVYHNYQNSPHSSWSGWFAQNATGVTNLNALTNADGRLEVFGIGSNGDIWHNYQTTPGGSWNGWVDHPGAHLKAGYQVARNGDGRLEVFGVGDNGDVWHDWQTSAGGAWHGYADMGGAGMNPRLSIGQNADGRLEMYGIGSNGNVWHNYQVVGGGGAWNGWGDVGSFGVGAKPGMAVGINPDGRLEVFGATTAGVVWHRYQNVAGGSWTPWYSLGGSGLDSQLMVANNANGALQVFAISGNDLAIWTNYQTTPGGGWNGWFSMGNAGIRFFYGQP
jgi:GH25 family lysozyme M1 (1,4-beta-N-acetylmuramidase)